MTATPASFASLSTEESALPSIEPTTTTLQPFVIMFSICETCVSTLFSANCKSTS